MSNFKCGHHEDGTAFAHISVFVEVGGRGVGRIAEQSKLRRRNEINVHQQYQFRRRCVQGQVAKVVDWVQIVILLDSRRVAVEERNRHSP